MAWRPSVRHGTKRIRITFRSRDTMLMTHEGDAWVLTRLKRWRPKSRLDRAAFNRAVGSTGE